MTQHKLLVKVYMDGEIKRAGEFVEYSGPPNWKFEPVDARSRAEWKRSAADPLRVEVNLSESGDDLSVAGDV